MCTENFICFFINVLRFSKVMLLLNSKGVYQEFLERTYFLFLSILFFFSCFFLCREHICVTASAYIGYTSIPHHSGKYICLVKTKNNVKKEPYKAEVVVNTNSCVQFPSAIGPTVCLECRDLSFTVTVI